MQATTGDGGEDYFLRLLVVRPRPTGKGPREQGDGSHEGRKGRSGRRTWSVA